jgi:hypothetical protein
VYRRYDAVHHPCRLPGTRRRATGPLLQSGLRCFAIGLRQPVTRRPLRRNLAPAYPVRKSPAQDTTGCVLDATRAKHRPEQLSRTAGVMQSDNQTSGCTSATPRTDAIGG